MITLMISDDFDLQKIAESGQCFRWYAAGEHTTRLIAADCCLYVTDLEEGRFRMDCGQETFDSFWASYFDLNENYRAIRERVSSSEDPFLWEAMEHEKGIRILRQDPWEMLISFIIAQNRNIPAIRRSIELLCEACGEEKTDSRGVPYFSFPGPEAVCRLSETDLLACKLGYRWKYVHAAAASVLNREIGLDALAALPCGESIQALTGIYGIGNKVASCIALFGLHQLDAFPRDVWINRVLENEYPQGYPFEAYSPYNGVYQQYMFSYYRNRCPVSRQGSSE